ncbi:MAG: tetratricopeptide repeat protein [Parvibaculaceae bacterium]
MTFTCKMQLAARRVPRAALGAFLLLAGLHTYAIAERGQETGSPAPSATAGDQLRFDEGIRAYDAGDYAHAFEIWLPLAQAGDLAAQRNVAHLLRLGQGTEMDRPRALYFYERAARAGLTSAALNAGMMRLEEDTDYHDDEKAAEWLGLAATAGSPIAQWELSQLLFAGRGIRQDKDAALLLLEKAAAAGHEAAREQLAERRPPSPDVAAEPPAEAPQPAPPPGVSLVTPEQGAAFMQGIYLFDAGDYAGAAENWRPLADAGVAEAQFRLGQLYQFGLGMGRDIEQARRWLGAAADSGHAEARKALKSLPEAPDGAL